MAITYPNSLDLVVLLDQGHEKGFVFLSKSGNQTSDLHRLTLKGGTQQKCTRTCVMILSVPSPSSSLNMMSGLSFVTSFLNLGSSLLIRPSARPLAPRVFSETFGTCCLYTRGVLLPVLCLRPDPRGDAHCNDGPVSMRNANTAA